MFEGAFVGNKVKVIEYLEDFWSPMTDSSEYQQLLTDAFERGNMDCLDYWVEKKKFQLWSSLLNETAARKGDLSQIKWLLNHGLAFEPRFVSNVVRREHLEILEWYHSQGHVVDPHGVFVQGVHSDNFDMVEWATEKGLRLEQEHMDLVMRWGRLEMAKWLLEKKCPYNRFEIRKIALHNASTPTASIFKFWLAIDPDLKSVACQMVASQMESNTHHNIVLIKKLHEQFDCPLTRQATEIPLTCGPRNYKEYLDYCMAKGVPLSDLCLAQTVAAQAWGLTDHLLAKKCPLTARVLASSIRIGMAFSVPCSTIHRLISFPLR